MARRRNRSDEAPGWVWMLFGLGIGLIIALGVYMNSRPQALPESPPIAAAPAPAPVVAQPAPEPQPEPESATQTAPEPADAESLGVADTNDGEDPNGFGFYDFLETFEVVIPEVETAERRSENVVAIDEPGVYMLQAGSFLAQADAEAQRARLALLGVEARIQRVSIDDRHFHRVRIGPIEDLEELNSIRARLSEAIIESIVMRLNQ